MQVVKDRFEVDIEGNRRRDLQKSSRGGGGGGGRTVAPLEIEDAYELGTYEEGRGPGGLVSVVIVRTL